MVAATQAYTVSQLLKKYPGSRKGANSAIAQMPGDRKIHQSVRKHMGKDNSVFVLTQVVADKVSRERLGVCVWEGGRDRDTVVYSPIQPATSKTFVVFLIHNAPLPSPFLHPPIYRTTWYMYISVEPE